MTSFLYQSINCYIDFDIDISESLFLFPSSVLTHSNQGIKSLQLEHFHWFSVTFLLVIFSLPQVWTTAPASINEQSRQLLDQVDIYTRSWLMCFFDQQNKNNWNPDAMKKKIKPTCFQWYSWAQKSPAPVAWGPHLLPAAVNMSRWSCWSTLANTW